MPYYSSQICEILTAIIHSNVSYIIDIPVIFQLSPTFTSSLPQLPRPLSSYTARRTRCGAAAPWMWWSPPLGSAGRAGCGSFICERRREFIAWSWCCYRYYIYMFLLYLIVSYGIIIVIELLLCKSMLILLIFVVIKCSRVTIMMIFHSLMFAGAKVGLKIQESLYSHVVVV